MVRAIGFILGALMLVDGLVGTARPRLGFQIWERWFRSYYPESLNELVAEYERLSDAAIRLLAIWELKMAVLILWLAGKARD